MTNLRKYYRLEKVTDFTYDIIFIQPRIEADNSGKCVGRAVQDVNGYFYLELLDTRGLINELSLKIYLDALETLNKPYEEEIAKYFKDNESAPLEIKTDEKVRLIGV